MKLQQAFISEASDEAGSWAKIGYTAPGTASTNKGETANFVYEGPITEDKVAIAEAGSGWTAKNIPALNDCPKNPNTAPWVIEISADETTGAAVFTADVKDTDCKLLTPSFENIGDKK